MIDVHLEYDQVEKLPFDENWIQAICKKILNDNKHYEANITIIFSNDSKYNKLFAISLLLIKGIIS